MDCFCSFLSVTVLAISDLISCKLHMSIQLIMFCIKLCKIPIDIIVLEIGCSKKIAKMMHITCCYVGSHYMKGILCML